MSRKKVVLFAAVITVALCMGVDAIHKKTEELEEQQKHFEAGIENPINWKYFSMENPHNFSVDVYSDKVAFYNEYTDNEPCVVGELLIPIQEGWKKEICEYLDCKPLQECTAKDKGIKLYETVSNEDGSTVFIVETAIDIYSFQVSSFDVDIKKCLKNMLENTSFDAETEYADCPNYPYKGMSEKEISCTKLGKPDNVVEDKPSDLRPSARWRTEYNWYDDKGAIFCRVTVDQYSDSAEISDIFSDDFYGTVFESEVWAAYNIGEKTVEGYVPIVIGHSSWQDLYNAEKPSFHNKEYLAKACWKLTH